VACMCGRQGALTCGGACGCSGESSLLGAVEKATAEAEKHGDRSEKLSALVAEAKGMIEQAKTKQAERAKAAAAVTAAAEAAEAAQRLHDEEELAALTLRVHQVQARLGSSVVPPADAEETMCVVCFDAPKDHILVPCYHLCVCEACANLLTQMDKPTCPICRAAIRQTNKVFQS
jgi:transcription elongation GreA/GreB family factor